MSILVPSKDFSLPESAVCKARLVDIAAWQAHITKHVLGSGVSRRQKGTHWDAEGWLDVRPPVVNEQTREALFERLRGTRDTNVACRLPEVSPQKGNNTGAKEACYSCARTTECAREFSALPSSQNGALDVGAGYRDVIERLLYEAAPSKLVEVPRASLMRVLCQCWKTPSALDELLVVSGGGLDGGNHEPSCLGVRINEATGLRVELRQLESLMWRTCYRKTLTTAMEKISFLQKLASPMPSPRRAKYFSETCFVTRQWWDTHGLPALG